MCVLAQASSDRKQLDIGANLFVGNLDPNLDERMLFDTFASFGTLVSTANVRLSLSLLFPLLNLSPLPDRSRPNNRCLQGLRLHLVRLVRSLGRRDRIHERAVPHEQARHSRLRLQEGRQGRTPRYSRRTPPRHSSAEEQRPTPLGPRQRDDPPSAAFDDVPAPAVDGRTGLWHAGHDAGASASASGVRDGGQ